MRFPPLLLVAISVQVLAGAAFAFDICEESYSNPQELSRLIGGAAIAGAPVKYHELARNIKLVMKGPGERLIPFAVVQQGTNFVVVPPEFAKVACEMAIAEYLIIGGVQKAAFDQAVESAARCFDTGGSQKCLVQFASELANRYRKAFTELPADAQRLAFVLSRSALDQVVMHEYAHHFLNHFARIKTQKITRIDAEFEADLFSVLNAVQDGEPPSAMYYFFNGMAEIERHTKRLATEDYERGSCRAGNVNNITAFFGIAPIVLIDAAFGGGHSLRRNSPSTVRSIAKEQFAGAPPALRPGYCGRIAKVALGDSWAELRRLYLRIEEDVDFLFAEGKDLDVARANRLLRDLLEMSEGFRYMHGVAAKCVSLILRKWGLAGKKLTPLTGQLDRLLDAQALAGNFLSVDFGRLLQAQGLAILQERADLSAQSRLDRSFSLLQRAVHYNPGQTEAWANLAMIDFKRGDCATASRFAERSLATQSPEENEEGMRFMARKLKELSLDPEACRAASAKFQPYPDL